MITHKNQDDAKRIMTKLVFYWEARGFEVIAHLEKVNIQGHPYWVIRSNIVNGWPTRKLAA